MTILGCSSPMSIKAWITTTSRIISCGWPPDVTLILEIKGYEDDEIKAKHDAAKRWVAAVNNWGQLGKWMFHVCHNPQMLAKELGFPCQTVRARSLAP